MFRKYFLLGLLLFGTTASSVCLADDEAVALPFEETFDSEAAMEKFIVLDLNNDNSTWEYAKFNNQDYQSVRYRYSNNDANDWLLTPQFQLAPGREYKLKFKSWIGDTKYNKEFIEVAFGKGEDPAAYNFIMAKTQVTTNVNDKEEFEVIFSVIEPGLYRIGFHALSVKNQYFMYLDDISVEAGALNTAPAAVTDFTVTPAPLGELKATVNFTTPTLTNEGMTLEGIQKVELKRGKDLIKTFDNPATGQALSFEDALTDNGFVTYTATAYGIDGSDGTPASQTAYVGIDEPGQVMSVSTRDSYDGDIIVTWQTPSEVGINGGYVDLSSLTYNVYVVRSGIAFPQQRELTSLSYTAENIIFSKSEQELYNYGVSVTTAAGEGSMKLGEGVLVGDCYTLPFHESFKGGMSYYWWLDRTGENTFRRIGKESDMYDMSSDNDWGAVTWTADKAGDEAWLNSGKIELAAASNPALTFSAYCYNSTDAKLEVEIWDGENNKKVVKTIDMNTWNEGNGWHEFLVDLTEFRSKEYVVIHFHAISNDTESPMLIDNINVAENIGYNLFTTVSAPSRAVVGDEKTIVATVGNNGRNDIDNYKVRLYIDNKVVEEKNLQNIIHNSEVEVPFTYTVKVSDGDVLKIQTEVVCEEDEIDGDSESSIVEMKIGQTDLPAVDDLKALVSTESMAFSWTAPLTADYQTTDDFDFYEAWLTSGFGRWTTFDGDKGLTYDLGYQYEFPHHGEAFAFIVFNPAEAGINTLNNPQFEAYSGDQYLACFNADTELTPNGNNDWLISPELSGNAQTLKFYAKSISSNELESFEVLTSTSGAGVSNFTNKVLTVNEAENDWNRYTAEIPAGARYFAIHVVSKDKFALLVDDVTYEPKQPEIIGYRLYCNGELVDETDAETTAFTLTPLPSSNVADYRVTVVYAEGESPLSNECVDETLGIESVSSDQLNDKSAELFTIDGRRIVNNPSQGIYLLRKSDGTVKKIMVK